MISAFYSKIPRRVKLIILFLIIILIAYFVLRFVGTETRNVPPDFLNARQQASAIALEIVTISNNSSTDFNTIAQLDSQGKYTDALNLVSQELQRNAEARTKAIDLSNQLTTMAKNLNKISPASASQTALEAISSETALISRLIDYNDYLTQLLQVLQDKFLGKVNGDNIPELISKINGEAKTINDLNQQFNDIMAQFDVK
jgi:hypothetical protein